MCALHRRFLEWLFQIAVELPGGQAMTSEAHQRWLDCTCGTCIALAEVAYNRTEWLALFEHTKQCCPNWSQPANEPTCTQPGADGCGQLPLEGVEP